jgi:WD40 repeat protein
MDPVDAIVRIVTTDGQVAGTGFIAGRTPRVVTCMHVLTAAGAGSTGVVRVELFRGGQAFSCRVVSERTRDVRAEDVAVLDIELPEEELARLPRVELGSSFTAAGKSLATYGFPPARGREGLHGKCDVIARTSEGGFDALQLRSGELTYGFSGAPAWDNETNLVVGMVVSIIPPELDRGDRLRDTAFIRTIEIVRLVGGFQLLDGVPYRGLSAFEESNADEFYGRTRKIRELISKLSRNHAVLVTGVSGTGKSSLVRAGLAKGMKEWAVPGIAGRQRVLITPTLTPLTTLQAALAELTPSMRSSYAKPEVAPLPSDALRAERALDVAAFADILRSQAAVVPIIVVIDQLERIYTNCPDEEIRRCFMDFLQAAASDQVRFVLALRLDYSEAVQQHQFFQRLGDAAVILDQMTEDELAEAITQPARRLGRSVEPKTVDALISDVRDRPGDLPLLQFALTELWEADNQKGVLTFDSYKNLGYETPEERIPGARGSIVKRAEAEWNRLQAAQGGTEGQTEFMKLFLKLVQVSSTIAGPTMPASRRAWMTEFDEQSGKHAQALADSFLLTAGQDPVSGQPTIEVAHEALIRSWPRLREVIKDHRGFVIWYSDFAFDLQKSLRNPKHSLDSESLKKAVQWQRREPELIAGPAQGFIEANLSRRRWKRAAVSAVATVGVAITIILLVVSYRARVSRANELLARADELREKGITNIANHDYQSAEILLAKSLTLFDSPETRVHLLNARVGANPLVAVQQLQGKPLASSNSGTWIVLGPQDGTASSAKFIVSVANRRTGAVIPTSVPYDEHMRYGIGDDGTIVYGDRRGKLTKLIPATGSEPWTKQVTVGVDSLAISPNGANVAVGTLDGRVELRDANTGNVTAFATPHRLAVHVVRFQPNRLAIASGGADRSVYLWDCSKTTAVKLGTHADFVSILAFSPDGSTLASGGADGAVRLWDTSERSGEGATPRLITSFLGHLGTVKALAINKARQVLSGSEDNTLRIWDRDASLEVAQFDTGDEVELVFADDDMNRAAAATSSGSIRAWDLAHRDEEFTIYNSGPVATVAISPGDRYVAAAGQDGVITVWELNTAKFIRTMHITSAAPAVWSICFTPDGEGLISGGEDGVIRLWNIADGRKREFRFGEDVMQAKKSGNVWTIAIHPNGRWAAFGVAALEMSRIHVMDLESWTLVQTIPHPNASVWSIAFNHSGDLLAVGSGDKTMDLWSVQDMQNPRKLSAVNSEQEMWGVPFSPDDKNLASAGLDRHVRIWSVPDLKVTESFEKKNDHAGLVQSADFDSTGRWVATASVDRTVKLWNLQTREVIPVGGHDGPAWWVAFSRTSDTFVSGGLDRRLVVSHLGKIERVFHAPPSELFQDARKHTCLDLKGSDVKYIGCPNTNGSQTEMSASLH